MLVIGELINTSRKKIRQAVDEKDEAYLTEIAKQQADAGADFLDVNCGTVLDKEPETLEWLVKLAQNATGKPLCVDSPNPAALERGLAAHQGKAMINSISAEKERFDGIAPLAVKYKASLVALCMDDSGMPETADKTVQVAKDLTKMLNDKGIPNEDIYLDPLVRPVGAGSHYGTMFLESLRRIKEEIPGVHTTCGLSNVSYGLPVRKHLNRAFMVMAVAMGLDSVILDPLDKNMMALLYASEVLVGRDEFCANYIAAHREGRLEF